MRTCEDCQLAWQGDSTNCPRCGKEEVPMFDNGGPAFPVPYHPDQQWENSSGMPLRDYLAAKAMQGILSAAGYKGDIEYDDDVVAENAYLMADAMLEARKK